MLPAPAAAEGFTLNNVLCIDIPYFMHDSKGDAIFMGAGVGYYVIGLISLQVECRVDLSGNDKSGPLFFAGVGISTLLQLQLGYGTEQAYFRVRSLLSLSRTFPWFEETDRTPPKFAGFGLLIQVETSKRNSNIGTGLALVF